MDSIANDSVWSATHLFEHLRLLQNLIPRCNEGAARAWIDVFFFRVSRMVPAGQYMAFSMDQVVPVVTLSDQSLNTISGYTAALMDSAQLSSFLDRPKWRPDNTVLFVSEAKYGSDLKTQIPQVVIDMLGCARRSGNSSSGVV